MKTLFLRSVLGLLMLCSLQFQRAKAQEILEIDYALENYSPPTPRAITIPNGEKSTTSITSIAALDSALISHVVAVPLDSTKYLLFYPSTGEEVTDSAIIRYIEYNLLYEAIRREVLDSLSVELRE